MVMYVEGKCWMRTDEWEDKLQGFVIKLCKTKGIETEEKHQEHNRR